jgi:hypothetical protein
VAGFGWTLARRFGTTRWRTPDQDRWLPLRWPDISFSQGAEWNALIKMYIHTVPFSGDACCAAAQSMSCGPPLRAAIRNAMIAKVGAAARHTQSAAPKAAVGRHSSCVAIKPLQISKHSARTDSGDIGAFTQIASGINFRH